MIHKNDYDLLLSIKIKSYVRTWEPGYGCSKPEESVAQ